MYNQISPSDLQMRSKHTHSQAQFEFKVVIFATLITRRKDRCIINLSSKYEEDIASEIVRKYYVMCLTRAFWITFSDLVMNHEPECHSVRGVPNTYDRVQMGTTKRKVSMVVLRT